ncbi:MAG: HNH endonuclease [Balneola sp.]
MIAIGTTDQDWFEYLRDLNKDIKLSLINFWTPTPWNFKALEKGDRFYFMLKSPIRKIGGYGIFERYEENLPSEAWEKYLQSNGASALNELLNRVDKYAGKNSIEYQKGNIDKIGSIILTDPVFFDDSDFFDPHAFGFEYSKHIVKFKTFDSDFTHSLNHNINFTKEETNDYQLIDENIPIDKELIEKKKRESQSLFRKQLLKAYDYKCAVSRETSVEVLEACHIQPYKNNDSNHIQNGLLLRADLHILFDKGFIYIDEDYRIWISSTLNSKFYNSYHGRHIHLPNNESDKPSKLALKHHKENMFQN